MSAWSSEFKVGLVGIVAIVFAVWFVLITDDRPDGAINGYVVYAEFENAEGVYPHSQVRMAGVPVGSVLDVQLSGGVARLAIEMSGEVTLPTDSVVELKGAGVLGDKTVAVVPGTAAALLKNGDTIKTRKGGIDVEGLTTKVTDITVDVKAITSSLRATLEDEKLRSNLDATVENMKALSEQMRDITAANQAEVSAIATNMRDISETLKRLVNAGGPEVESQLVRIHETIDSLNRTAGEVEQIAGRINAGEGTLGYLINNDTPARQVEETLGQVNRTVDEVNALVSSVNDLQAQVFYDGAFYVGTSPQSGLSTNPAHLGSRNAIGVRVMPREDYWYVVEIVDHPLGSIEQTETSYPDLGESYTRYVRTLDTRFSFQFERRYGNLGFRLGMKDSSGGVGADAWLWHDRLWLSADLYDFTYGSWPLLDGTPNLTLGAKVEPYPHLFVQAGLYNVLFGARHGFATGYVGGGIRFDDNDIRLILATLPGLP